MTKEELLLHLQDILERDESITEDMMLEDIDEWDSLAAMGVMAFFNKKLNIRLTPVEVRGFKIVKDIMEKANL